MTTLRLIKPEHISQASSILFSYLQITNLHLKASQSEQHMILFNTEKKTTKELRYTSRGERQGIDVCKYIKKYEELNFLSST